jgi:glucosamine--fructose-6-phosphate aminotransferase (isomerizing)
VDKKTSHTYQEITSQPAAWAEAAEVVQKHTSELEALHLKNYSQVLCIGCGSTYYLGLATAALLQTMTGKIARALPSSELLWYPTSAYPGRAERSLLVSLSRSGATTETIRAVEAFRREGRGDVISITNYPESPLAPMGDINLIIPAGREESIAQTRSFASMCVAATGLSAVLAGDRTLLGSLAGLRPVGERLLRNYHALARQWGEDSQLNQFFFLGSGPRYGLACEASLKMKEMTLSVSEPFHFPEFRHGPMSMITPQTLVIGLLSDAARSIEEAVLKDMKALGGRILSLAEDDADVTFASHLPELMRGVLYMPVLQLLAYYRSISRGLDPDRPHNLSKVIELKV